MMTHFRSWPRKRWLLLLMAIVLGAVVAGGWWLRPPNVAALTMTVSRGEFVDTLELRGEAKALRSISITAPAEASEFQIVKIAADIQC